MVLTEKPFIGRVDHKKEVSAISRLRKAVIKGLRRRQECGSCEDLSEGSYDITVLCTYEGINTKVKPAECGLHCPIYSDGETKE